MKNHILTTVLATSMMLVGCSASSDEDTSATSIEDTAAPETESDTAGPTDDLQQEPPRSITEEDRRRIVAYGACFMIRQSAISIMNDQKQRGIAGSEIDSVIATQAYQAAVYEILAGEFYGKYDQIIDEDSYLAISNEWRTNVYLPYLRDNQYRLTLDKVSSWSREFCPQWSTEESSRVEREHSDIFDEFVERNKQFMIPTVPQ